MDKEEYIALKAEDVHRRLITDVALNMDKAGEFLEELTATDRYKEDHIFRASIETSKVYILSYRGKTSEVIKRCSHLIEVAVILQEWELLSFDYNMMGNAYFLLGLYEKALEYYYISITLEREHGLKNTLPVSYANIGLVFLNVGLYEKSVEYLRLALGYIEYADKDYFRFREKKIHILADIITAITKMENPNIEELNEIYNQLISFNLEGIDPSIIDAYYIGLMYYYFWKKDYDKAKQAYFEARKYVITDYINKIAVVYSFIEECDKHGLDIEFFADEVLEAESMETHGNAIDEPVVYKNLRKYYLMQGNQQKADELYKKYIVFLENDIELSKKKQADSIQIIENALKLNKDIGFEEDKDKEFKLVAEEAIRNKNELQKTYDRLRIIHEIGIKLTSSTDLNEVVKLIYKNICENILVDTFMFLAAEPENNQLRSLLSYNMGIMSDGFTISLSNKESSFVKCCLYNKIITTEDNDFSPFLGHIDDEEHPPDEDIMRSALFIPLSIGDKVIGAYSIQSRYPSAYSPETLDFLNELHPYLVIALNNAIHSGKLQNEIARNKEIQEKLKEANCMLSRIAGLDALTQISNRREFTEKFHALRKEAVNGKKMISVFMFDVDDFKKYNDTYGHFAGDDALKRAANIINNNIIAHQGIAARFGGEEFISACIGLTEQESYDLGDKIRQEIFDLGIENKNTESGILSMSIGIAISKPNKVITKAEIMGMADEMLYEAKKTGKNKVVIKVLE